MTLPTVLVLASGRGERFVASGGQGSKLRALLAGRPVLERTLDAVRASGLPWHLEDAGHAGMGDSIAAAVTATADAAGWLVLPGDLPLVRPDTLLSVAHALVDPFAPGATDDPSGHPHPGVAVVVPCHRGQRGHPVGFAAACLAALRALRGQHGAAAVLREQAARGAVLQLPVDDVGIVTDIDTLADLAHAETAWLRAYRAGST